MAKADVTKRLFAATIDGMLVATTLGLYRSSESLLYGLVGAAYVLLQDAMSGRSVGKFFCGLVVINLETGRRFGRVPPSAETLSCCCHGPTLSPRSWR